METVEAAPIITRLRTAAFLPPASARLQIHFGLQNIRGTAISRAIDVWIALETLCPYNMIPFLSFCVSRENHREIRQKAMRIPNHFE